MRHTAADYLLFTLNSEVALGSWHPQHFEKQRNFKFEVNKRQPATLQCNLYYNNKTEARRGRELHFVNASLPLLSPLPARWMDYTGAEHASRNPLLVVPLLLLLRV